MDFTITYAGEKIPITAPDLAKIAQVVFAGTAQVVPVKGNVSLLISPHIPFIVREVKPAASPSFG